MRIAHGFRRLDVDAMLGEVDHDQYVEWQAFFMLEPIGWPSIQMIVRRLVWAVFQSRRPTRIDEFPFQTRADAALTPEQQRLRNEIDGIKARARAQAERAKKRHGKANQQS